MKTFSGESQSEMSQATDTSMAKLLFAHKEIQRAWFEHWASEQRKQIELTFGNNLTSTSGQKQAR
jgi:hypothetical protein